MSELILILHSASRWALLFVSAATALTALVALANGREWRPRHGRLAQLFVASVDLQVLLGLTLYFGVSPLARAARQVWSSGGLAALWANFELVFFGLIHPALALSAAITAHAGWIAARRTDRDAERHRRLGSAAALTLVICLAAIPWPFLGHERPWLRLW